VVVNFSLFCEPREVTLSSEAQQPFSLFRKVFFEPSV
jgi:hypothetical protein